MTFPFPVASSHDIAYWPTDDVHVQMWPTAGSLSDTVLIAAVGSRDDAAGALLRVRAYDPAGTLLGSIDMNMDAGGTFWLPASGPCRTGDGVHVVQAFVTETANGTARIIGYSPVTGSIAYDTTVDATDVYTFWTHEDIAYIGHFSGTATRINAVTGAQLSDVSASSAWETLQGYRVDDIESSPYADDAVITVPAIGPFAPGYVMARLSGLQPEGGGVIGFGGAGNDRGGIAFSPSGRSAICAAITGYQSPSNIVSWWASAITFGGITPPLRQRQRSDGLAASGAPRQHQRATLQTSIRQRAIR